LRGVGDQKKKKKKKKKRKKKKKKKKKERKETVEVISSESDKEWAHSLRSAFLDEHWEIMGKTPEPHSLVHEQQVEGLLHFAERITLPYINETRDYAEDAYSTIRGGGHY